MILLTFVLLLVIPHPSSAKPPQRSKGAKASNLTPKQIFTRSQSAILTIETDKGNGTGFLVGRGILAITCYHVIDGATHITVKDHKGRTLPLIKVSVDKSTDSAVLIVEGYADLKPLTCVSSANVEAGDPIVVIGNPLGFLSQTLTTGIVSGKRRDGNAKLIQIDAAISPGSSGSPIINNKGQAVGFVSFTFTRGQALNMGVACLEANGSIQRGFRTYEQFIADNGASRKIITEPQVATQSAEKPIESSITELPPAVSSDDAVRAEEARHDAISASYARIIGELYRPLIELEVSQAKWANKDLSDDTLRSRSGEAYNDIAGTVNAKIASELPSGYMTQSNLDSLFKVREIMLDYTSEMAKMATAYKYDNNDAYNSAFKEMSSKHRLLRIYLKNCKSAI